MSIRNATRPYARHIPQILVLQIVTKGLIGVVLLALRAFSSWVFASQGRVSISSGDFTFLFTCWQGWLLIVATVVMLYVSFALDVNTMVVFSGYAVRGEEVPNKRVLGEGLHAITSFLRPGGLLVVLYAALMVPLLGVGIGVSITEGFQIPSFISSVIEATPLYNAAYTIVMIVMLVIGFIRAFTIHAAVLDGMPAKQAIRYSKSIMRVHWKDFLFKIIRFDLCVGVLVFAVAVLSNFVFVVLPDFVLPNTGQSDALVRYATIALFAISLVLFRLVRLLAGPFILMKMTQLYYEYAKDEPIEIPVMRARLLKPVTVALCVLLAIILAMSAAATARFDELFPDESSAQIIAHRAGGVEGHENTVAGIYAGAEAGAWGSEIDIQRTADGAYVVNHDSTFERVAGVDKAPEEMTLAEVKELRVDGEPVPTYEEMLEAARDRVVLFVELKGATADERMADDAVRIAREAGMLDQIEIISLDYHLIDYVTSKYPDVKTAYLAFACYGDTEALDCTDIAFEELSCTPSTMQNAHAQGKRSFAWTVNSVDSQHRFLCSEVDAIITDNVAQAAAEREALSRRGDIRRMMDVITFAW